MAEFKNCKLELKLRAQTPLIHFQHAQVGATIRASEVKPKLDRFIIEKWKKEAGIEPGIGDKAALKKIKELYGSCFQSEEFSKDDSANNALKYKMQISTTAQNIVIPIKDYPIFYGNMSSGNVAADELKQGVLSSPTISILCFHTKLQEYIAKYIEEFFLVTNFGTMQGKGFGSFAPISFSNPQRTLEPAQEKQIAGYLKEAFGATRCYAMRFKGNRSYRDDDTVCKSMFEQIKTFYSVMKSGQNFSGYARSYIYEYAHQKMGIGNEKAWLKQEKIAPAVCKDANKERFEKQTARERHEPRYVRALLGVGGFVEFGNALVMKEMRDGSKKEVLGEKEHITIQNAELDRVPSPIFFKIVNNVVFIVAGQVPEEVYDKVFTFTNGTTKGERAGRSGEIRTPAKGTFDIQDFLKEYVYYYNSDLDTDKVAGRGLRKKLSNLNRNNFVKVVEIS